MKRIGNWLTALVVLFPSLLMADVTITAEFDRKTVAVGDTVNFIVNVGSKAQVAIEEPRLPNLTDFDLLNSQSSRSTSSTFVNGQFTVEHSIRYVYLVSPRKEGVAKIGPVEVVVNGESRLTKPQSIQVAKAGAQQRMVQPRGRGRQRQQQQRRSPFDDDMDIFNQLLRRQGIQGAPGGIANGDPSDFFIDVVVDKKSAYVGEPVMASWYLYTRANITEIDTLKYPSLNGFWKEDIEVATRLNFERVAVDGVLYRRALLVSYALFPIKAGQAKIDPYEAKCTISLGGFLGSGRRRVITKKSKDIPIQVKALPAAGKPDNFTGAVGNFGVKANLKSKQFKVNSPISYEIVFQGEGNAKRIDLPDLKLPDGLELYDTISEAKFYKSGRSEKKFELLIVPRYAGAMEIPEMTFAMFDPKSGRYYERKLDPVSINVLPGEGNQTIASKPLEKSGAGAVATTGPSLPGILLAWDDTAPFLSAYRMHIWTLSFLLGFLFLLWKASIEFQWFNKSSGLQEEVKKRFSDLSSKAKAGDVRAVGIEGSNLIYHVLGEISGEGGANREINRLLDLSPPVVRQELGDGLKKQLAFFELLGFAPEEIVKQKSNDKDIRTNLKELEKLLSKSIKVSNSLFSTKPSLEG